MTVYTQLYSLETLGYTHTQAHFLEHESLIYDSRYGNIREELFGGKTSVCYAGINDWIELIKSLQLCSESQGCHVCGLEINQVTSSHRQTRNHFNFHTFFTSQREQ